MPTVCFAYSALSNILLVAVLMGRCLFVLFNIPRSLDALNVPLFVSMTWGHLVLEDKNKSHLAAVVHEGMLCSTFEMQFRDQTNLTNIKLYTRGEITHMHTTFMNTYLLCILCKHGKHTKHTFWPSRLLPVGVFPCSHAREVKLFCWLCLDLWQFHQFLTLNYRPPWEKDRKLLRETLNPPISVEVQLIFKIFTPFGAACPLEGPICHNGGVWWYDLPLVSVCCVPPLPLRKPFRLLSPRQPTDTWLRPLGLSWE